MTEMSCVRCGARGEAVISTIGADGPVSHCGGLRSALIYHRLNLNARFVPTILPPRIESEV